MESGLNQGIRAGLGKKPGHLGGSALKASDEQKKKVSKGTPSRLYIKARLQGERRATKEELWRQTKEIAARRTGKKYFRTHLEGMKNESSFHHLGKMVERK